MAEEDKTEETEAAPEEQRAVEDPNREGVIAALRRERAGYVLRKLDDRVADVDAELQRLGAVEERADTAPRENAAESKPRSRAARGKPSGD